MTQPRFKDRLELELQRAMGSAKASPLYLKLSLPCQSCSLGALDTFDRVQPSPFCSLAGKFTTHKPRSIDNYTFI